MPNLIKQNDGQPPKLYIKAIADLETELRESINEHELARLRIVHDGPAVSTDEALDLMKAVG